MLLTDWINAVEDANDIPRVFDIFAVPVVVQFTRGNSNEIGPMSLGEE